MLRPTCLAACLALAVLTVSCGAHAAPQTSAAPAAEAAIRAALEGTAAGWNRGDLAAYLAPYTDDVTSNGANGFETGRDAVERVMRQGFWRTGRPLQQLRYEHLQVRMLGRDHALATGQFVLTGADRPDRTGWFTTIWVRTGNGWRMLHDHSG